MKTFKKILFPIDFSDCSTSVFPLALDLAEKLDARLHMLFVARDISYLKAIDIPGDMLLNSVADVARAGENQMEKIAVSAESPHLDDFLDPRFGRAAGFLIVDPQTLEHEYLDNGASQVGTQGAVIQAAEIVVQAGAKVVLTGFVGPKAFQALQAAGVAIGQDLEGLTVREAIRRYISGDIDLATGPNRRGHGR